MTYYTFDIPPRAKPRMTRRDKTFYNQSKQVKDYFAWKNALLLMAGKQSFTLGDKVAIAFHIGMPDSWSKKKKSTMNGKPHKNRPDIDNLIKAVFDSLAVDDDSYIHELHCSKSWTDKPRIEIMNL